MAISELGPIALGDKSVLDYALTHATSGLALYPAFDAIWRDGHSVIAPEKVTITRLSGGSYSGYSVYATGESKLRYYITHLRQLQRPSVGRTVLEGGLLGVVGSVAEFPGARVAHAHVGINVELLLGADKQLKYGRDGDGPPYTVGSPTIRQQLKALLEDELELVEVDKLAEQAAHYVKTDEGPGPLSALKNRIFWKLVAAEKRGLSSSDAVLRDKLAKIHELSA